MRVAVAGLHTETNTFSPVAADLATFDGVGVLHGDRLLRALAESHHTVTGFLDACREHGSDVVPLSYANAYACGTVTAEAFERVAREIVDGLAEHGPFDVVLLAQHGAAVAEGHLDADAELVSRVRAAIGPDVVLGVGLDLHGNISKALVDAADVCVGYRENPHRDPRPRGAECATLALRAARGEIRPVQRLVRLPMVVPILGGWTSAGAMREVMAAAERIAGEHGLLSYSVFHGFGYADVPQLGSSVLAVADGDLDAAAVAAAEIASVLWSRRDELEGDALAPGDAVAAAQGATTGGAADAGPIVLLDVGDNIGGGSPGDSTVLVAEAIERAADGFVATICDPSAAERAVAAGIGAEVELTLGRTTPVSVGPELRLRCRVAACGDGRFEDPRPTHGGFRYFDAGPTALVITDAGQELIVSTRAIGSFSPEQLRSVGVEPSERRIVVAKGVVAPRAGYEPVARDFLLVDTPGITTADLTQLDYDHRPRPLWPFDRDADWSPE